MNDQILMIIIFGTTVVFILGAGFFIMNFFFSESTVVNKRMDALKSGAPAPNYQIQATGILKEENDWKRYSIFSELPPVFNLPVLFEQAGKKVNVVAWLIKVGISAFIVTVATWVFIQAVFPTLLALGLSIAIPYTAVILKRKKRIANFEQSLAQTLEILSRSLRAGHPLTMGMQMVSTEMPDPIGTEFGRVFYEQQMGLPLDESLKQMAQRVPLIDVRFFVITVLIQQQTGGDLAEVLGNLSHVIRERFKVLGQVKALTAEGRLSGWVLSALPFIVFGIILFVNPNYLNLLLTDPLGIKMLYIAGAMQVIGMLIIRKIVNINV